MDKKLRDSKKKAAYQMRTHLIHSNADNTRWDYVSVLGDVGVLGDVAVLEVFCNGARRVRRETVKAINAATSPISPHGGAVDGSAVTRAQQACQLCCLAPLSLAPLPGLLGHL